MSRDTLTELFEVLEQRKSASADSSYVASLYHKGTNKILEKIGEEAIETVLAAKDFDTEASSSHRSEVIKETADLWFHSMVMLSHLDIDLNELTEELARRFGTSGHEEKAARKQSS